MVGYYRGRKSRMRVETRKDPFQILTLLCRFSLESKIKVADVRRDERKCKFTFILEGYNISSVLHFLLFSTYCEFTKIMSFFVVDRYSNSRIIGTDATCFSQFMYICMYYVSHSNGANTLMKSRASRNELKVTKLGASYPICFCEIYLYNTQLPRCDFIKGSAPKS